MGNVGAFVFIISFMLIFNTLLGYYAITESTTLDIDKPTLPVNPSILDYILTTMSYVGYMFQIVTFSIAGIPAIFTVFVVIMDIAGGYLLLNMITGG